MLNGTVIRQELNSQIYCPFYCQIFAKFRPEKYALHSPLLGSGGGGGARGDFFRIFAELKYTIVSRIFIFFWREMILISHILILFFNCQISMSSSIK